MKRISPKAIQYQIDYAIEHNKGVMLEVLLKPIIESSVQAQLDTDRKDVKELMQEIIPFINHKDDCLIYRQNYLDALMGEGDPNVRIERGCNCNVEALKEKMLK